MDDATPLHSVSVAGAVYDRVTDSFLVIKRRDNSRWELPGGVLELNETVEEGVVREVLEETGVTVRPIKLTGIYKNMRQHVIALVFLCETFKGEPHATNEASEVIWMPTRELKSRMKEAFRVRLTDAMQTGHVAIRSHDGTSLL